MWRSSVSVSLVAVALVASGCSSDAPNVVGATVQTAPLSTAQRVETTTAPTTSSATTSVQTSVQTTSTSSTTSSVAPPGVVPIFTTASFFDDPALDTYPVVSGEWTDRDYALVAAGSQREYTVQTTTRTPDLKRIEIWSTGDNLERQLQALGVIAKNRTVYRSGNISDFVVYQVEVIDQDIVLVNACERNNMAEFSVGDEADPGDDVLIQDDVGIRHVQRALSERAKGWVVSGYLELEKSRCVELFS